MPVDEATSASQAALHEIAGRLNASATHGAVERMRLILALVPGRLCLTTSFGVEDQLLTYAAAEVGGIEIVTLDTGRLFSETHDLWRETERRCGLTIRAFEPARGAVAELVARDGLDGFYDSVAKRRACCGVRKTEPLGRALAGASGWITGLRAEQSEERADVAFASVDPARRLLKLCPLHDWTRDAVLAELRAHAVPVSRLESRGYRSVGCEPCTRALRPGEPERAGRWWWENGDSKECGLHVARAA
jgi:phosphoadenosine phosphosulfate reductase